MPDQKGLTELGFSRGERNLFAALVAFAGVFLLVMALPALTGEGTGHVEGGGADGTPAAAAPVQEVAVVMTDFAFEPASFQFDAGDHVRFVVENRGKVPHEFRLTSGASVDAHIQGGHEHDESADASGDMWVLASPGETQTLEVTFTSDTTYDLAACLIPGHFEAGMSGPLSIAGATVTAAAHDDNHDDGTAEHDEEEATHDEDDSHQEGEATHDEDATEHDEDEATHDDDAEHDDQEATHEEAGETDAADVGREIAVTMTEFAFEPSTIEVAAGETIRFLLHNQGVIEHEFRLSSQHSVDEHLASGHEGHDDGGSEAAHGHGDVIVLVDGGETAEVVVTFEEGTEFDVMACLLPDHYEAGMWGTVTVTG